MLALKQELSRQQEEFYSLIAASADVVCELDTITNVSKAIIVNSQHVMPAIDMGEMLWLDAVHKDDWDTHQHQDGGARIFRINFFDYLFIMRKL